MAWLASRHSRCQQRKASNSGGILVPGAAQKDLERNDRLLPAMAESVQERVDACEAKLQDR